MTFMLQLESVGVDEGKAYIERLWGKQVDLVNDLKEAQIDEGDTDPNMVDGESGNEENEYSFVKQEKNQVIIRKTQLQEN